MHLLSWWHHILFPQIFLLIRFLSSFCLFSVFMFYRNFCTNRITTKMQLYSVEKNCFPIACSFIVSNGTKKNNKSTKQATTYPENRSELNLPLECQGKHHVTYPAELCIQRCACQLTAFLHRERNYVFQIYYQPGNTSQDPFSLVPLQYISDLDLKQQHMGYEMMKLHPTILWAPPWVR